MLKPYTFLPHHRPASDAWPWDSHLGRFTEVIGYTWLGDLFLRDPRSGEVGVLLIFSGNVHGSGYFDIRGFEAECLANSGVIEKVLNPALVSAIHERVGPLEPEQVYIPEPYPILGGSGAPSTYTKGPLWVFLSLVGQTHGLS